MVVHGPYPVGEPRVAREVAAALAAGYAVDVVAMRRAGEPWRESVDGAHIVRLPLSHHRGAGLVRMIGEYVGFTTLASCVVATLMLRRRYGVVQVHNPPDFLMAAGLIPRALGAYVVFDVHDLSSDMFAMRWAGKPGARIAERLLRALERGAAGIADAVVTVHEPYRRELEARGVPARKLVVVMNTLDETLLPQHPTPADERIFRIVYHGTVTPLYGVPLLVEACALIADRVPDFRLEIYGEGDSLGDVRQRADELGIGDRVVISDGYLAHRDVLERVAGAGAGVVPNLPTPMNRFALSSKLFEYIALEIPVVCSELPTIKEHFPDGELRYFQPGDARSLADALLETALQPEARETRVRRALVRYESYRWPVHAARYEQVLERSAVAPDGAPVVPGTETAGAAPRA
jgi:glycosyltransferase involved in cell wall biosynthesis